MSFSNSGNSFFLGKVVYWSEQDRYGLLIDPFLNEYYFDESTLKDRGKFLDQNWKLIINEQCFVEFKVDNQIKNTPTCLEVKITAKKKHKAFDQIQKEIEEQI